MCTFVVIFKVTNKALDISQPLSVNKACSLNPDPLLSYCGGLGFLFLQSTYAVYIDYGGRFTIKFIGIFEEMAPCFFRQR